MSNARRTKNPTSERYERYLPIVTYVSNTNEFDVEDVQQACPAEQPAFVSRLINELVDQGWLIREAGVGTIRWNLGRGKFSATKWLDEKLDGRQVKASPESGRPRERLLAQGARHLENYELIAILVRSGRPGESAVMAGEKVAKEFDARIQDLPSAGRGELKGISSAIEKTAYCQIMAGIELGRRVAAATSQQTEVTKISGTQDAIAFCRNHFARLSADGKQEEFHIVTLGTKNQIISTHCITVGTLNASLVHPREVFRAAIKDAAASIILAHNHPSGDPTPSHEDIAVTERLESAGKLLGIDVLDHIVVTTHAAVSIREHR